MAEKKNEVEVKKENPVLDLDNVLQGLDPSIKDFAGMGLENMDASDFKIPMYAILQPLSQIVQDEKGKGGEFWDATSKESLGNELEVIFISFTKPRVRWAGEFARGAKPLCRSFDGITGTGVPGGNCAKCPLSQWNGNEKPECSQGFTWLAYDVKRQTPFRITAMSSHVKPTKEFLSAFAMSKYGSPKKGEGYPLFAFKQALRTVKEQNQKGTYYVPKYASFKTMEGILGVSSKDEIETIISTMSTYQDLLKKDFEHNTESFYGEDINDDSNENFETVEKSDSDAF